MEENSLAKYFGITAPELPKFIVANTFLTQFFDKNDNVQIDYELLKTSIICEEESVDVKKKIIHSFNQYVNEYLGNALLKKEKISNIYLPVTQNIIYGYKPNLRNLLFHLLDATERFDKESFQENICQFLWGNVDEAQGNTYILSKLLTKTDIKKKKTADKDSEFGKQKEEVYFKNLGKRLLSDMNLMFDSEHFNTLDFYKKYDYLSTLLTTYVTLFTAYRGNFGEAPAMLCKGSVRSAQNNGDFHKACVAVHNRVRSGYAILLKDYYWERIIIKDDTAKDSKVKDGGANYITIYMEKGEVRVWFGRKEKNFSFADFIENEDYNVHGGTPAQMDKRANKTADLLKFFNLPRYDGENKEKDGIRLTKEDFAFRYAEFHKKNHPSNMIKITSVFSSSGAAIRLIHPPKAGKAKYFALSGEIAEFFVRLYIADINQTKQSETFQYGFLDGFIVWLKDKYHLHIDDDLILKSFLKKDNLAIKLSDFNANRRCLIENLTTINCLIKISDSAYIVTLPEKKGDFKGL